MILPTKRLSQDRAMLNVGGEILSLLKTPKTVSRLWEELYKTRKNKSYTATITYDWFILSLDMLYAVGAIELDRGLLRKSRA